MADLVKLPPDLMSLFAGKGFASRHGLVLPLVTVDHEGYPRTALLSFGEIRARSRCELAVAVQAGSHTAANLIRRPAALLSYLGRHRAVWVQVRAGRGHTCASDPEKQIFPLSIVRVKIDAANPAEGPVTLLSGPIFTASEPERVFSAQLFEELGQDPCA